MEIENVNEETILDVSKEEKNKIEWYNRWDVQEFIFNMLEKREVSILNEEVGVFRRCNHIYKKEYLLQFLNFNKGYLEKSNLYMSTAKYGFMPPMVKDGKRLSNDYFWKKAKSTIINYDILLDFDLQNGRGNSLGRVITEYLEMYFLLNRFKIRFIPLFSGSFFHILIMYDKPVFELIFEGESDVLMDYQNFVKYLKTKTGLINICLYNAGTYNRITKVPFSIAKNRVCKILDVNDITYLVNLRKGSGLRSALNIHFSYDVQKKISIFPDFKTYIYNEKEDRENFFTFIEYLKKL